jgi:hypothetical protein
MKKITTIVVAIMATIGQLFSTTTYLVQLGSGTPSSTTWRATGSGETLVDLTVNAQTLTAWLTSKTFASGDQVWIAAGTYNISTGYTYPANLSIYGGFAGTETATSQRVKGNDAWSFTNETIIDGGTTMTVVVFTATSTKAGFLVDGITITRNASTSNGCFFVRDGVTVQNCKFISNTGGAVAYFGPGSAQSSATITGCYFYNNSCTSGNGAGVNSNTNTASSSMTINYCFFENNSNSHATTGGGGLRLSGSGANTVKNCIFKSNNGTAGGSAVSLNNAASTLTNCLIYGSTGSRAVYIGGGTLYNCTVVNNTLGGIYFAATTAGSNIYNSVFWGTDANSGTISSVGSNANGVVKNCAYTSISANLTGGASMIANNVVLPVTNTTGTNAPYFVDPATNNWKLSSSSSLKSIGSNTWATANTTSDLIGKSRGSGYDIGAYQYAVSYLPVITFTDNLSSLTYGGSTVSLTGTSTSTTANAGAPVTYTSGNTGFVSINRQTLTIAGAGSTTVTAHQSANSFYDAAADVSQNTTVNPITLTLASASASSKVYDGTNSAAVSGTLTGAINSDAVTCTTGTFGSVNVGNDIAVTCVLGGAKAGNYTLTQPGLTANITAASSPIAGGNLNNSGLTDNQLANTNLTVSSGEFIINDTKTVHSLTVAPGAKLTLSSGNLTATNGITLQSSSAGTATFVDNNNSSPQAITATVEQYLGSASARNYYITPPVAGAAVPSGQTYYSYDETGSNTGFVNPATLYWKAETQGSSLDPRKGYIAQTSGVTTLSFTGTLNTGIQTPLTLTRTNSALKPGFNLVANPYPSYLDWKLVSAANSGLSTTAWFRTKDNSGGYIFATVNVANPLSPVIVAVDPNTTITTLIPPMQAYWVRVNAVGSTTYVVNNTMRAHADNTSNKFKAPAQSTQPLLRLRISNGTNADETVVLFNTNATNGMDMFDSPKMSNNSTSVPEIFTQIDLEKLVINGLKDIVYNTEIPIGFSTLQAGDFTISANELSNFENGTRVILLDKLNPSVETELSNGTVYNFSAPITEATTSRFSLLFRAPGVTTNVDNWTKLNAQVFVNAANQITIIAPEKNNYAIYNAVGQLIENGILNYKLNTVNYKLNTGVYVVKVGNQSNRVIIK